MNMERSIPNNDPQQLPSSPKKKLHTKEKSTLEDTITSARSSLKNGKDISARNLMDVPIRKPPSRAPSLEFDLKLAHDCSESSVEEIIALDEEHTDFVSNAAADDFDDDEETIVEEIIEEYYEEEVVQDDYDEDETEDSELEPLPPPIVIPEALRVKDSDDEEDDDVDDEDSDDGNDDDNRKPAVVVQPKKQQSTKPSQQQPVVTADANKVVKETPSATNVEEANNSLPSSTTGDITAIAMPVVTSTPKAPIANNNDNHGRPIQSESTAPNKKAYESLGKKNETSNGDDDVTTDIAWEKPDWTKTSNLKSTGVSPSKNLAKPITQLPQLVGKNVIDVSSNDTNEPSMTFPKSPHAPSKVSVASANAPKSAPQPDGGRKKYVVPVENDNDGNETDDDFASKITWEKPEWAKKKVLRKTSKTDTILSGGKLERPIGGIRPIE